MIVVGVWYQSKAMVWYDVIDPVFHDAGDIVRHPMVFVGRAYVDLDSTGRGVRCVVISKFLL